MFKRILITEDSPTILAMTKDILESAGYGVLCAVDGQEALDKARKECPDLIILDLMLPKLDGYKICRMLKFDEKYKHTFIYRMILPYYKQLYQYVYKYIHLKVMIRLGMLL